MTPTINDAPRNSSTSADDAQHQEVDARSPSLEGRPAILLSVWTALLVFFAVVAPILQEALNVSYDVFSFVMLAPAAASLIVLIRPRWFPWAWHSAPVRNVLLSSLIAAAAVLVFAFVLALALGRTPRFDGISVGASAAVFLLLQLFGVIGEEVGWRGVVQQTGEQLGKPAVVSAIAGFVFGATHLGYWSLGPLPVLTFALTAMFMSLTITTIFQGSFVQRMIPSVVVHLGVNLTIASLTTGEEATATTVFGLGAAIAMFIFAVVLIKIGRIWSESSAPNRRRLVRKASR